MKGIHEMMGARTIVGDPIETPDGAVILPVSRVSIGFAAGGGQYGAHRSGDFPFAGGSGAGIHIQPVGFLVVGRRRLRLLSLQPGDTLDRLVEMAPDLIDQLQKWTGLDGRHHDQLSPDAGAPRRSQ